MRITRQNLREQVETAQQRGYIRSYERASRATGYSVALLLAKDSRESCLGQCLDAQFKGDSGNAWGLSQIDQRYHPAFTAATSPRNHDAVVMKGANILQEYDADLNLGLDAALAAYNAGPQNVRDAVRAGLSVDAFTTGGDYSADVLQRFQAVAEMFPAYDRPQRVRAGGSLMAILLGGAAVTYIGLHAFPNAFTAR